MQKIIVFLIIIVFLALAYFLNIYFQKLINPRRSFGHLMFYFLTTVIMILVLTFLMVLIIGTLYPQEIMK